MAINQAETPLNSDVSLTRRLIRERNRAARLRHEAINLSCDVVDLSKALVDTEAERDAIGCELDMALDVLSKLYETMSPALRAIADKNLRREIVAARHFLQKHELLEESNV